MARKDEMGVQVRSHTQDEDLVRLYLDNIGKYPLLTQERGVAACRRPSRKDRKRKTNWTRGKVTAARRPASSGRGRTRRCR